MTYPDRTCDLLTLYLHSAASNSHSLANDSDYIMDQEKLMTIINHKYAKIMSFRLLFYKDPVEKMIVYPVFY